MNLPDALDAALRAYYPTRGVVSPVTSPRGLAARMTALERAHGNSGSAAARAAGVGESSWRAWKTRGSSHRPISARNAIKVDAAYQTLLRGVKVRARGIPTSVDITAVVVADPGTPDKPGSRYKNTTPHRTFRADPAVNLRPTVEAWAAMKSPEDVAAELQDAISAAYGTYFGFEGTDVTVTFR